MGKMTSPRPGVKVGDDVFYEGSPAKVVAVEGGKVSLLTFTKEGVGRVPDAKKFEKA